MGQCKCAGEIREQGGHKSPLQSLITVLSMPSKVHLKPRFAFRLNVSLRRGTLSICSLLCRWVTLAPNMQAVTAGPSLWHALMEGRTQTSPVDRVTHNLPHLVSHVLQKKSHKDVVSSLIYTSNIALDLICHSGYLEELQLIVLSWQC